MDLSIDNMQKKDEKRDSLKEILQQSREKQKNSLDELGERIGKTLYAKGSIGLEAKKELKINDNVNVNAFTGGCAAFELDRGQFAFAIVKPKASVNLNLNLNIKIGEMASNANNLTYSAEIDSEKGLMPQFKEGRATTYKVGNLEINNPRTARRLTLTRVIKGPITVKAEFGIDLDEASKTLDYINNNGDRLARDTHKVVKDGLKEYIDTYNGLE